MPRSLTRILDLGTVVCAFVLTGLVLRRELRTRAAPELRDVRVVDWGGLSAKGHRLGSTTALVTIVEFSDFQCPYCARFAREVWPAVRNESGSDVAVVYRHWPLSIHPFATDAAVAAECAGVQQRFEEFHDALFAHQDSIGTWPFDRFANLAGVPSLKAFATCRASEAARAVVESDRRTAVQLRARGTPTFVVNGVMISGTLDAARIDSIVSSAKRSSEQKAKRGGVD